MPDEQELYDKFTGYIQRDNLWAIPNGGRSLITMVLWKLLVSSTYAIAVTIKKNAKGNALLIALEKGFSK